MFSATTQASDSATFRARHHLPVVSPPSSPRNSSYDRKRSAYASRTSSESSRGSRPNRRAVIDRITNLFRRKVSIDDECEHVPRMQGTTCIRTSSDLRHHLADISQTIFEKIGSQQDKDTYIKCLQLELESYGLFVESKKSFDLTYEDQVVGKYAVDLVVGTPSEEVVILQVKATDYISDNHTSEMEYYLDSLKLSCGYLIQFPHDAGFPRREGSSHFTTRLLSGEKPSGFRRAKPRNVNRNVTILEFVGCGKGSKKPKRNGATPERASFSTTKRWPALTKKNKDCKLCIKKGANNFCYLHDK